jgi:diguanylate cyclase (GGDEF)-like protein
MTAGRTQAVSAIAARSSPRLEIQVLVLQSTIALFFVCGALAGAWGRGGVSTAGASAWIVAYHAVHAWYVLRRRIRGRSNAAIEFATPLLDVSCITVAWVVLDNPNSPFWAVYLYALVSYARRVYSWRYFALTAFIVANLAGGWLWITAGDANRAGAADLVTMVVLAVVLASNSQAVGAGWRRAERAARILAETDPLTGIANRRVFLDELDHLATSSPEPFALLMLDLDDFKRMNDEHGHLYGDEVLQDVARVLAGNVRAGDRVARYGGEEFVVAMPQTAIEDATTIAERLRRAVSAATSTTVSVGCAVREPGEGADQVLKRADDMLLLAKRTGKDRVRWREMRKSA